MLSVSDTGMGMDKETQAHIFEPFFTTKDLDKGTGLGLATVYGIVKQSGGDIWVESNVGHGTLVQIYLPRVPQEKPPQGPERLDPGRPGTETILVVEDEGVVRTLVCRILKRHGYVVFEAAEAEEALRVATQHSGKIDLLLTDIVMPRISGLQLAERVTELRPEIRVLYTSGYADNALLSGREGIAFFEKPFTPDALMRKVREVLDSPIEEIAAKPVQRLAPVSKYAQTNSPSILV
jgi:CheY-like chemotaxis protein